MPKCLIGMGSNLGTPQETLQTAIESLSSSSKIEVISQSEWRAYPPIGGPSGQADFLNGALLLQTNLAPEDLAERLRETEQEAGRERVTRWAARTLDCDLLLYGTETVDKPTLTVPHPRMITRRFVLEPAAEIAGSMHHPELGWTVQQMYEHLSESTPVFAFLGSDPQRVAAFVREVAARTKAPTFDGNEGNVMLGSLSWPSTLEFSTQFTERLDRFATSTSGLFLSNGWFWQSLFGTEATAFQSRLAELESTRPKTEPRLLIPCETRDSEFGIWLRSLPEQLRLPTLWLSESQEHAIQDTIGAIHSMQ